MAELPAVRGLEPELKAAGIDLLLVNIHDETGAVLTERYDFELSPTYILFDAGGAEVWRGARPPTVSEVRRLSVEG